jgi:chromosome segregation ATPase
LKQYETNYRKTLTDLNIIKTNIVDIENRLSEAMRELEIERALVEGEHELVFKQILDASESDQQKIRHLYNDLQLLIERIMAEKTSIRNEIDYTQQTLFKLEHELRQLEEQYRPSDDKILKCV